ncbi:glutathione S-transferase C-terminal domain-containing protein [Pseudomonas resinovorans]|uniref:Glutathione S-transferase C-terminal domain-containing protein n=1 Tax=Metapseudomonas resinovorans TaxID=53412 RepID=A0ABT4Y360_METRE|nr:glutathione S-transferase C-terminal domain-containing protein [Pseudomonas resinovorans]MDA8483278.1 glutathione S-transferase C-terminal domain-containing protein [Pseudomonas resinovorans]
MKLFIADQTCSEAVQIIANELGLELDLVHFDVWNRTTSNGEDFTQINPLLYVPALQLDTADKDILTETIVITSYLADQFPDAGLVPPQGSLERAKFNQLLTFLATEIAQKHIPLMRKLLTEEGTAWTRDKLVKAYATLDARLADGRTWLTGEQFTVADAYVWGTFWHERSGAEIGHLKHLMAYKARMDERASVQKTIQDEAKVVADHKAMAQA